MKILETIVVAAAVSGLVFGLGYRFVIEPKLLMVSEAPVASQPVEVRESEDRIPRVVASATPAVVSIVISADVPVIERYYEEFNPFGGWFGESFGFSVPRQRQVGTERQEIGGGTGFFVSSDGYLVTNRHVVEQSEVEYSVVTNDGTTYEVEVIAKDPSLDVAILKVEGSEPFPYLSFASTSDLQLGESVIAIGNALAEFPNSVSAGVVSGLSRNIVASAGWRRTESLEGVIQTDAAINRGNSGGPLLNLDGAVIGVNVAVAGNGENIGFALPSDMVREVFESVRTHGEIVRPFLGVRYLTITPELAERNKLPVEAGVLVVRGETRGDLAVVPGSPADKAGIVENDILLAIDEIALDGSQSLASILRQYQVGDEIRIRLLHKGEEKTVTVTLAADSSGE